jgi:hypothetical protein
LGTVNAKAALNMQIHLTPDPDAVGTFLLAIVAAIISMAGRSEVPVTGSSCLRLIMVFFLALVLT